MLSGKILPVSLTLISLLVVNCGKKSSNKAAPGVPVESRPTETTVSGTIDATDNSGKGVGFPEKPIDVIPSEVKSAAEKAAAEKANGSKTYVLNLGFMCTEMREAQTVKMTDQEKSKLVEGTCPKQIPLEFKGQKLTQTLLGYCKLSEDIKVAYYDKTVFVVLVEQTAEKAKTSCETPGDNGDSGVWLPL